MDSIVASSDWVSLYARAVFSNNEGATSWEEPEGFVSLEQQLIDKTKDVKTLVVRTPIHAYSHIL